MKAREYEKYSGDQPEEAKHKEITGCTQAYIIAIDIEHITGKEAIEYVNAKNRKAPLLFDISAASK